MNVQPATALYVIFNSTLYHSIFSEAGTWQGIGYTPNTMLYGHKVYEAIFEISSTVQLSSFSGAMLSQDLLCEMVLQAVVWGAGYISSHPVAFYKTVSTQSLPWRVCGSVM